MPLPSPLPITILTGFLGTGKTTLLNRLLRLNHGMRLAVLVNDFGAINIDARLIDYLDEDSISLTNGCVCCSMRGNLVTSTLAVLERPQSPEHLIVEASGIADPIGVAAAFRTSALRQRTRVDGIITLVDAEQARNPRLDQQLIHDQIRSADVVVLNKVDLVDAPRRAELAGWIRSLAPGARVIEAVDAKVPFEVVMGIDSRRDLVRPPIDASDGRHLQFGTWSYSTEHPLAYRSVRAALERLPSEIFRAKGILALADAPNLPFTLQMVGRRIAIEPEGTWGERQPATELVCIGLPEAMTAQNLSDRLDACITTSVTLMTRQNLGLLKRRVRWKTLSA